MVSSKILNILVVGYGSIGKRHIRNLLTMKNLKIFLLSEQPIDNFLRKNKIKVFHSLDDIFQEHIDAAVIANTTDKHVKTAYVLAKNNIALFIEKPLSHSLDFCNKLVKLTKKNNIVTLMGCVLRFNPFIKKIHEIIMKKELGKVIFAQVECGSYLPDWHPYENYKESYAARKELGGGVVLTCIHEIDYLYWFFGNASEVISINGNLSELKISAEDFSSSIIKFNNNIISELHLDYFQRPSVRRCKIIGTKGTLFWDNSSNELKFFDINKKKWITKLKLKNYDWNQMYIDEIKYFVRCVKNQKNSFNTIEDGFETLKIALAIKQSSKLKKVKTV